MVAMGVGSVVLSALMSFCSFANRSFVSLTNYVDLDLRTESALDNMSREIRQVSKLTAYASNSLTFLDYDGGTLQYLYDRAREH